MAVNNKSKNACVRLLMHFGKHVNAKIVSMFCICVGRISLIYTETNVFKLEHAIMKSLPHHS